MYTNEVEGVEVEPAGNDAAWNARNCARFKEGINSLTAPIVSDAEETLFFQCPFRQCGALKEVRPDNEREVIYKCLEEPDFVIDCHGRSVVFN